MMNRSADENRRDDGIPADADDTTAHESAGRGSGRSASHEPDSAASPDAESGITTAAEEAPARTVGGALGEIVWLLSQSQAHRHALFLADLEWLVMPPLTLGQYRIFYGKGRPVGVALWAFVTEEAEKRLSSGGRLAAGEWRGGDRVWLVELVAPFGQPDVMLEDLHKTALADRRFRFIRMHPNGRRETVELTGVDAETP